MKTISIPVLLLASTLFASVAAARDDRAERAISSGRHDDVVEIVAADIAARGWSAPALVDLGNAHHRAGRVGAAMLAWERALRIDPSDDAARDNLARVRAERSLPAAPRGALDVVAALAPSRTWLAVGLGALVLLAVTSCARAFATRGRRALLVASLASGLVAGAAAAALWADAAWQRRGVVIAAGGTMTRISPFDDADPLVSVPEGGVVALGRAHGSWVRVATRDGSRGWAPADAIEAVVPAASL